MALLVLALGWLGWLLLDQDLSLKEQRIRVRVDTAAAELEGAFASGIAAMRENLNEITVVLKATPGTDIRSLGDLHQSQLTYIHFSPVGMTVSPQISFRYLPIIEERESLQAEFEQADRLEFQQKDYPAASRLLRLLAESPDKNVEVAALLRLGRIDRRNGRISEALASYQALAGFSGQKISSVPANWIGLYALCSIYEAENNVPQLRVELDRLVAALKRGGYPVSATTYRFYVDAADSWAGIAGWPDASQRLARLHAPSEMAADLFETWGNWREGAADAFGIKIGGTGSEHVLGIWTAFESDLLVGIIGFNEIAENSLAAITAKLESLGIGWRISDATGQALLTSGLISEGNPPSLRSLVIGGIALTVTSFATDSVVPDPNDVTRRRLLLTGLLLILLIILTSSYFISRSLRREAEISQLQSDFVAAVSHEFRTPLTSIRQLTELLASGRVTNREKAGAYYRILEKESARLQRLVEGLLDFGRMEAGAHRYRPKSLDCSTLLKDLVTSFKEENELTAAQISLEIKGALHVQMDKESLTRAIWNLLDNAVKYSPDTVKIDIRAQLESGRVSIAVHDRGVGISPDEQSVIFNKFVRGSAARLTNAKGTGMGLAIVRKIIEDQGGKINVRNNPNGGSVFEIFLTSTEPQ